MQANRKYIYVSAKAPIYMLPGSEASKCSKFRVTDIQEKPVDFFYGTTRGSTLAPKIILLTWAKVSVPVEPIIPCYKPRNLDFIGTVLQRIP